MNRHNSQMNITNYSDPFRWTETWRPDEHYQLHRSIQMHRDNGQMNITNYTDPYRRTETQPDEHSQLQRSIQKDRETMARWTLPITRSIQKDRETMAKPTLPITQIHTEGQRDNGQTLPITQIHTEGQRDDGQMNITNYTDPYRTERWRPNITNYTDPYRRTERWWPDQHYQLHRSIQIDREMTARQTLPITQMHTDGQRDNRQTNINNYIDPYAIHRDQNCWWFHAYLLQKIGTNLAKNLQQIKSLPKCWFDRHQNQLRPKIIHHFKNRERKKVVVSQKKSKTYMAVKNN